MRVWSETIVDIIKEHNKPLSRAELFDIVESRGLRVDYASFGVNLYYAKKAGIVGYIKIPPAKIGYYCNPHWLDEHGNLKPEYNRDPYWGNEKTSK